MQINKNQARATLTALADSVVARMQPPGRAANTAATLRQIAEIAGDLPLTPDDACHGYLWIGQPRDADDGPTTGRRATCRELSDMLLMSDRQREQGDHQRLAAVLERVAAHFADSTDPRQLAIAATSSREATELRRLVTVL